ncbi:DUF1259 domain-containing protein [candidate division KSB1 bacterium]|nr:DUF1259 domain-containing protein [candidate division KSB1 bacterium]
MKKFFTLFICLLSSTTATSQVSDWAEIEKVFDRKGTVQGEVFKIAFPRGDLQVKVGEVSIEPALALTSWIAFKKTESHTMIMGDLVLLDREIAPVTAKLVASGIEITALHNHIVNESPSVMYMHFGAHGDPKMLAEKMKAALALTGTPMGPPSASSTPNIDWSKIEATLGWNGQRKGNVLQLGIPRAEKISENGMEVPPFMGMATAINIQKVDEKAATTGDFVLLANEVNPVVKALTENGVAVTALHNHMLFESPRLFFLHFWGFDTPEKLAAGLKAALDKTNSVRNSKN